MIEETRCEAIRSVSDPARCERGAGHTGPHSARVGVSVVAWGFADTDVEVYWRGLQPVLAAQDDAARDLAPNLVGRSVAEARALVDEATERTGLDLSVRFATHTATADHAFGRITAWVRDGVVASVESG